MTEQSIAGQGRGGEPGVVGDRRQRDRDRQVTLQEFVFSAEERRGEGGGEGRGGEKG